ncbi:hypothetical protein PIIN_03209 [Serendipita indica DSM 11827]|uniref:Uncharacterized protein n=1 Tax=Serendipita indica (strain DSM 11827) TaxID=1109443 RepID=G4TDB7_SERID|nr:hypothetical protein PIIN_03209 [Serendipita indica DSM 11827]
MSSQPLPGRPERIYLPTEIWQTILRHAIFVPLFFDTDPLSSYGLAALRGYYDMSGYWDSERTRNKLRRVCSSWNAYLQHFAHRFVALKDVVHNHVPIAALPLAYRIHMTACKCFACINHGLQNTGHLASSVSRSDSKEPVDRSWRVEILEIDHHWLREDALLKILASKSHVRVYIRPLLIKVNKTIEHQSSSELRLYSGLPGTEICSVQNLSTLRLALDTSLVSTIPPMPNLKHLSVIFTDRENSRGRDLLINWLQQIGHQLLTLFWATGERVNYKLPIPIWSLCPSITSLQLPSDTLWSSPPPTHPITYLRLNLGPDRNENRSKCAYCDLFHPILTRYAGAPIDDIVRCGNIKTISFDRSWSMMLFYFDEGSDVACRYWWLRSHGIRYVDADLLTFEDYIISELEIGRSLRRTPPSRLFLF